MFSDITLNSIIVSASLPLSQILPHLFPVSMWSYYLSTSESATLITRIWILQFINFIFKFSIKLLDGILSIVEKKTNVVYSTHTHRHTHTYVINTGWYKSWKSFMLPIVSPRFRCLSLYFLNNGSYILIVFQLCIQTLSHISCLAKGEQLLVVKELTEPEICKFLMELCFWPHILVITLPFKKFFLGTSQSEFQLWFTQVLGIPFRFQRSL